MSGINVTTVFSIDAVISREVNSPVFLLFISSVIRPFTIFLDLSFNSLVQILPETFCNLPALKLLDLRYNFLDGVGTVASFELFDFAGQLELSFNFVHKLGVDFFARGLSNLTELNLKGK